MDKFFPKCTSAQKRVLFSPSHLCIKVYIWMYCLTWKAGVSDWGVLNRNHLCLCRQSANETRHFVYAMRKKPIPLLAWFTHKLPSDAWLFAPLSWDPFPRRTIVWSKLLESCAVNDYVFIYLSFMIMCSFIYVFIYSFIYSFNLWWTCTRTSLSSFDSSGPVPSLDLP